MLMWTWFIAMGSAGLDPFAWQEYWPLSVASFSSLMSRVPLGNSFCRWFTGSLLESGSVGAIRGRG